MILVFGRPAYGGRESTIVQPHEQIGAPGDREAGSRSSGTKNVKVPQASIGVAVMVTLHAPWLSACTTPGEENERHAPQLSWRIRPDFIPVYCSISPVKEVFFHLSVMSARDTRGTGARSKPALLHFLLGC
jgi:hypothetical protein